MSIVKLYLLLTVLSVVGVAITYKLSPLAIFLANTLAKYL